MSDEGASGRPKGGDDSGEVAKQIGDQVAILVRRARASGFDFLAYLLAMALKVARRLSAK